MYARNTDLDTLATVANELDMDLLETRNEGNRIKFTIRLKPGVSKFQKMNLRPSDIEWIAGEPIIPQWKMKKAGRAVCFHGHYAFFHRLFELSPDASVESSWYGKIIHTKETLMENAQKLGMTPLGPPGNIYHGFQVRETCYCLDSDPDPEGIYTGETNESYAARLGLSS